MTYHKKTLVDDRWSAAVLLGAGLLAFELFSGCSGAQVKAGNIQETPPVLTEQVTKAETNAAKAVEVKF